MAQEQPTPDNQPDTRVAPGRPRGAGHPLYADAALLLLENGYEPLPIIPRDKRPPMTRWTRVPIVERQVDQWQAEYPAFGVGLRTGRLVGLDIDLLDADLAHQVAALAVKLFGPTLLRVGRWPKRLLLYRCDEPIRKLSLGKVEILGSGQQLVAFGIHPDTGRAYDWPLGDTPLDVPLDDLPVVTEPGLQDYLGRIAPLLPKEAMGTPVRRGAPAGGNLPTRNADGLVHDGRDSWLSSIAFHAVHDTLERGEDLDPDRLSAMVWDRFVTSTDIDRPRKDGARTYRPGDARRKVADKLRLHRQGCLPPRLPPDVPPEYEVPTLSVEEARAELDATLAAACARVLAWWSGDEIGPAPQIGIRATVGLGKSTAARQHIGDLRKALREAGAPDRIVVCTPSHALAEEAAEGWREAGHRTTVLRGYERKVAAKPMCRDLGAVRLAIDAGLDVNSSVCAAEDGRRCRFFAGCPKQRNRREVADADVIVAPYDVLFTGFAVELASIGLIVIDEACWPRAIRHHRDLHVESFTSGPLAGLPSLSRLAQAAMTADLDACRLRAVAAFRANGPGALSKAAVIAAGLTAEDCRTAANLEHRRCREPRLRPGMSAEDRDNAEQVVAANRTAREMIRFWYATSELLLNGSQDSNGRIRLGKPDRATGLQTITISDRLQFHPNLTGKPVLHLDAMLRPKIARTILPDLEVTEIEAAAPHMHVRLVTGGFGKSALCTDPAAAEDEQRRRQRKLADIVDYVRWHALRHSLGRTLVVTYKDCEAAFADIPGVETAHFNAIAGLDVYRDVSLLVVIGRPLPRDSDLPPMAGALFGSEPKGAYERSLAGVRMASGSTTAIRTLRHVNEQAQEIRAAICDDEVLQAIGRGRGVNRTADNPLEVHLLTDVALPIAYECVRAWETEAPDIFQRMLLAGVAVDSPADAVALHPALFGNAEQAKKALDAVFKGNLSYNIYRGISLKSAAYRREGRGRGWQRVWWLPDGEAVDRQRLVDALGPIAGWTVSDS